LQNRRLLIFAACAVLFQVANAPMLPLVSGMLAHVGKREAAPLVATLIIVPQITVAMLAALGRKARRRTWTQAAAARRVRRLANPRGTVCFDR
jgi:hypothetical protein